MCYVVGMKHVFTSALRTIRKQKGLSQEAFGAACGLPRTRICNIESERFGLSEQSLGHILACIGMTWELFGKYCDEEMKTS